MILGKKIKQKRLELKMTQEDLAGGEITRNMLSLIESNKAMPSVSTIKYIAKRLNVPAAYLISDDDDLFFYSKKEWIKPIKSALESKNYAACINLALKLEHLDDELCFILAKCYFELGIHAAKSGALKSALKYLDLCLDFCTRTVYDTGRFECTAPMYVAICTNFSAPLLEFDEGKFIPLLAEVIDYEFYKYLTLDYEFNFSSNILKAHMDAKKLIKERKYSDALEILSKIEENKSSYEYNAYIMYGIYGDMDLCYKKLFDFEKAYRYANKMLSLAESFNE